VNPTHCDGVLFRSHRFRGAPFQITHDATESTVHPYRLAMSNFQGSMSMTVLDSCNLG
jgi:hypothetical protein